MPFIASLAPLADRPQLSWAAHLFFVLAEPRRESHSDRPTAIMFGVSRWHLATSWAALILGVVAFFGTLTVAAYEIHGGSSVCTDPRQDSATGVAEVFWVPPGVQCTYESLDPPGEIVVDVPQGRTILILLGATSISLAWSSMAGWSRRIARALLGTLSILFLLGLAVLLFA